MNDIDDSNWTDDIKKQWSDWSDANPVDSFRDVDYDELKSRVITELSYVSQMDVKEYTLYQKWCEVHEKFPIQKISTLFGDEVSLLDPEQGELIDSIKNNIWIPEKRG
jgi:hypothetical protein